MTIVSSSGRLSAHDNVYRSCAHPAKQESARKWLVVRIPLNHMPRVKNALHIREGDLAAAHLLQSMNFVDEAARTRHAQRSGSSSTIASPLTTASPRWFTQSVRTVAMRFSASNAVTSHSAVTVSPMATGSRKRMVWLR